jgi:hypothetical protein
MNDVRKQGYLYIYIYIYIGIKFYETPWDQYLNLILFIEKKM